MRRTASLYKVYSTPGSIQLTTCKFCGRDVDPYIEREWLLVIMDCVLHRPEAFRHLLYNREPFSTLDDAESSDDPSFDEGSEENKKSSGVASSTTSCESQKTCDNITLLRRLLRYSVLASLLRAYVWYVAQGADREERDLGREAIFSFAQSLVGELVLVYTTIISSSYFAKRETMHPSTAFFYSRIHLAVTIPVFFHVATIFALIWENSSTVPLLGTVLILSFQHKGVSIAMEERMCRTKPFSKEASVSDGSPKNRFAYVAYSVPFLAGLFMRTFVVHIIKHALASYTDTEKDVLACTGLLLPGSFLFCTESICVV